MAKYKDISFGKSFKYSATQDEYTFRLRKKHNWWWLLLLLLLPLLLVRCHHDITVTVVDGKTKDPQAGVSVVADYTSHIPLKDGKLLSHSHHEYEETTDSEGKAVLKDVECSVFSYIFYCGSKIHIVADDIKSVDKAYHYTRHVTIELENVDCEIEIVMCIDNTGSMGGTIDMVKKNALNFCDDLTEACKKRHRNVKNIWLSVIPFGDLKEEAIEASEVFHIPGQEDNYKEFVSHIVAHGGGDTPENGLEALAMAIKTPWHKSKFRLRHVVVVYTDAPAHDLNNPDTHTEYYPDDMPKDFAALTKMWDKMDEDTRRLVLFAPNSTPWGNISKKWDNVSHRTEDLNSVLKGSGYEEVLDAICKSL